MLESTITHIAWQVHAIIMAYTVTSPRGGAPRVSGYIYYIYPGITMVPLPRMVLTYDVILSLKTSA